MFLGSHEVDNINNSNRNKAFTTVELTARPYHKRTVPVVCKRDTGAETNVIPKIEFEKIITRAGPCFSKVPKRFGSVSAATISFISS